MLHVLGVRRAVHGRLAAELVERVLRLSLRRLGVRLETSLQLASYLRFKHHIATSTANYTIENSGKISDFELALDTYWDKLQGKLE